MCAYPDARADADKLSQLADDECAASGIGEAMIERFPASKTQPRAEKLFECL